MILLLGGLRDGTAVGMATRCRPAIGIVVEGELVRAVIHVHVTRIAVLMLGRRRIHLSIQYPSFYLLIFYHYDSENSFDHLTG